MHLNIFKAALSWLRVNSMTLGANHNFGVSLLQVYRPSRPQGLRQSRAGDFVADSERLNGVEVYCMYICTINPQGFKLVTRTRYSDPMDHDRLRSPSTTKYTLAQPYVSCTT